MINNLIKNKETNRYETKEGLWLSSPSRILKPLTFEKYNEIPAWQLEKASTFGKELHEIVEIFHRLDNDQKEVESLLYTPRHKNTFKQYLEWLKEYKVKVLATEKLVYNEEKRYYGFVDLLCIINNELHIVDLKTRSSLKDNDNWLCEKLQLELYNLAIVNNEENTLMWEKLCNEDSKRKIKKSILIINKNTKNMRLFKTIDLTKNEHEILNTLLALHTQILKQKEQK